MGRAAWFIRLQGCDQSCPWCDSASTWHPNFKPEDLWRPTAKELADEVDGEAPREAFVVVTGGEPGLWVLDELLDELHSIGRKVHIETAGHKFLPVEKLDWITLSPKPFAIHPTQKNVLAASEFKVIVDTIPNAVKGISLCVEGSGPIWLHPEWSQRQNPEVLAWIVEQVTTFPGRFRAGWQLHKLYKADIMDERARSEYVPLGGVDDGL